VSELQQELEVTKHRLKMAEEEEAEWAKKNVADAGGDHDLRVWDVVQVLDNTELGLGIVRWIGAIPDVRFAGNTFVAVEWGTPVGDSTGILNVKGEKFGFGPVPKGFATFENISNCRYIPGEKWLKKLMLKQNEIQLLLGNKDE